ncbi:MAG: hypothetical protein ACRBBN_15835 [Methyloligellaceae bacterium]
MSSSLDQDIEELCDFLKGHKEITNVQFSKQDNNLTLNISTVEKSSINRDFIQSILKSYFNLQHEYNLVIDNPRQVAVLGDDDDDDLVIVAKPKIRPKSATQPIVSYLTEKKDWKLFRFYSQAGKTFEEEYFSPREDIAKKEISNLEDTYSHILSDLQNKVFMRNIIELNINCMNSNELKGLYIEALRGLPIQLKNRLAISLVRIPGNVSIHVLRQAALICKLCTDNIFLSFPYQGILEQKKLSQIYGISGYIITVEKGTVSTFEEVKKIYERLNTLFPDKRVFVIFSEEKDYGATYRSSNIARLHEREKIGVEGSPTP